MVPPTDNPFVVSLSNHPNRHSRAPTVIPAAPTVIPAPPPSFPRKRESKSRALTNPSFPRPHRHSGEGRNPEILAPAANRPQWCYTSDDNPSPKPNPGRHRPMELVDLNRYEITALLGTGADYDVRAAVDRETQQQVVLKRPVPQAISRGMHGPIEARTQRTIEFYQEIGSRITQLSPIVGYTEPANHDDFYGDSNNNEYRVLVVSRAHGIPLAGDVRARILRVPVGAGQNLFALFPLPYLESDQPFGIQSQILDMQEQLSQAGYVLLDLGPQNIFYQPATNAITVIDSGDLLDLNQPTESRSRRPRDIHDCFMELIKYYVTPQTPPESVDGYRDFYGMRPVITLEEEMDEIAVRFAQAGGPVESAALNVINKIHDRAYADFADFRQDLTGFLEEVRIRNRDLPTLPTAKTAWREAAELLKADHWRRYIFDPDTELAAFDNFS